MLDLFDGRFFQMGGDESPHARWEACPKCCQRMKNHRLKSTEELQNWSINHFAQYLAKKGRRLISWDETLEGGLPKGTAVMSQRRIEGGQAAATLGHEVAMKPNQFVSLDYFQVAGDDACDFGKILTPGTVYGCDPALEIPTQFHNFIFGTQGDVWAEVIRNQSALKWKMFPRIVAIAKIAWTEPAVKEWNRFVTCLAKVELGRLKRRTMNTAPIAMGKEMGWKVGEIGTNWVTREWVVTGAVGKLGSTNCVRAFGRKERFAGERCEADGWGLRREKRIRNRIYRLPNQFLVWVL
jgi:hexosaminidase